MLTVGLSVADPNLEPLIASILALSPIKSQVMCFDTSLTRELMLTAKLAVAKSGTCNLELALLGTPTVVIYAISKIDAFIAEKIFKIKLPFYSLPNLILNRSLFPELYGPHLTYEALVQNMDSMLKPSPEFEPSVIALQTLLGPNNPGKTLALELLRTIYPIH